MVSKHTSWNKTDFIPVDVNNGDWCMAHCLSETCNAVYDAILRIV